MGVRCVGYRNGAALGYSEQVQKLPLTGCIDSSSSGPMCWRSVVHVPMRQAHAAGVIFAEERDVVARQVKKEMVRNRALQVFFQTGVIQLPVLSSGGPLANARIGDPHTM